MPKKQKNGLYRSKVTIGHEADGKPIYKYASGRTTRELAENIRAIQEYYILGTAPADDMPFGQYAVEWYKTRKEPFLRSASTKENYRTVLNKHILPAFGERHLRAIAPVDLQKWLNGYAGKSKTTIDDLYNTIRAIMSSAQADGILVRDPSARLMKPVPSQPKTRRALTQEERKAVKQLIQTEKHGDFLGVLYYLGLRRGEALGLKWGDFDWKNNLVHVQRDIDFVAKGKERAEGALKTASSDRFIPVPTELRTLLYPMRGLPDVYLFRGDRNSEPLSKSTAERIWIDLMIAGGFAEPRQVEKGKEWKHPDARMKWQVTVTPHYMRHNYATMLWEAGMDPVAAMRLLGHANYQTTAKIYTHLQEEHLKRLAMNIDSVFTVQQMRPNVMHAAPQYAAVYRGLD